MLFLTCQTFQRKFDEKLFFWTHPNAASDVVSFFFAVAAIECDAMLILKAISN